MDYDLKGCVQQVLDFMDSEKIEDTSDFISRVGQTYNAGDGQIVFGVKDHHVSKTYCMSLVFKGSFGIPTEVQINPGLIYMQILVKNPRLVRNYSFLGLDPNGVIIWNKEFIGTDFQVIRRELENLVSVLDS